jgi:hypothetical protein
VTGAAKEEGPKADQGVWGGQAQVAPACGCLENGVCGVVNSWLLERGGGAAQRSGAATTGVPGTEGPFGGVIFRVINPIDFFAPLLDEA